jgi:hypothetical protein
VSNALCAVGVLMSGCATTSHPRDKTAERWVRAEMAHVVVETDADPAVARSLARDVEELLSAMVTVALPTSRPSRRLEVIAIRDEEFASLPSTALGFFDDRRYIGPVFVVRVPGGSNGPRFLKRELARSLVATRLHRVPQWLSEGLTLNLEAIEIDHTLARATWGQLKRAEVDEWRASMPSTRDLDQHPWPAEDTRRRALGSRLLVRMLARRHQDQWECMIRRLSALEKYEAVVEHCFPFRNDWEGEYADEGSSDAVLGAAHIQLAKAEVALTPMTQADADAVLAVAIDGIRRLVSTDDPRQRLLTSASNAHLKRALAVDPTNVPAALLQWMAATSDDESDDESFGRLSARLVVAHPEDWRAWCWRADLVSTPIVEIRNALAKALVLAPDRAEVIELLAYDAVRQDRWEEAAQFAWTAFTLRPSEDIAWNLVFTTLEWLGRCDEARTFLASSRDIDNWVRDNLKRPRGELIRPHHCVDP